jgi:hypothetical protein
MATLQHPDKPHAIEPRQSVIAWMRIDWRLMQAKQITISPA